MSLVEERYQQAIDAMTPAEKIHRMWTLSAWGREMLARRIQAEEGPMSLERLKALVALRLYGNDPESRKLIERRLADVPD